MRVRVRVRLGVRARVHACVRACSNLRVCMHMRVVSVWREKWVGQLAQPSRLQDEELGVMAVSMSFDSDAAPQNGAAP